MTDDGNPPLGFVGSHNGGVQDWRNLHYEHSIAPQDVKYQFTGQVSYDLPIGKGQAVNLNGAANAFAGRLDRQCHRLSEHGRPHQRAGLGNNAVVFQSAGRHGLRSFEGGSAHSERLVQHQLFRSARN